MNIQSSAGMQPSKKRIIIVTVAMAGIVLVLLIAVIGIVSGKKTKQAGEIAENTTSTEAGDDAGQNKDATKDADSENLAPVSNSDSSAATSSDNADLPEVKGGDNTAGGATGAEEMPTTGPVDLLPLIILAGVSTTFICSCFAYKKNA